MVTHKAWEKNLLIKYLCPRDFRRGEMEEKMNEILIEQCKYLVDETLPNIANISNLIALLFHEIENINWLGFYICDEKNQECTLGPFQGKVACTRIPYGKGVVGTCAKTQETQRIDDVHKFAGHIACDCASNSEICIPLKKDGKLVAILDRIYKTR